MGIVVNPRSGTDVRRAVAAAGAVTIEDKANVVRRVVLGAREAGVDRFVVHTDTHRIVQRATETMRGLDLHWLDHEPTFTEEDTVAAVAAMRDLGCAVVVVLGGDGTNRAAARAWPDLVVVPLSTGTNNVFPVLAEATVAGAAAGHVATGRVAVRPKTIGSVPSESRSGGVPTDRGFSGDLFGAVANRAMVVRVRPDGAAVPDDLALIDAVAVDDPYLGSFELFEPANLRTAVLSRADPAAVGFAGVGGLIEPVAPDEEAGLLLRFGLAEDCERVVRGPTAPGHYADLGLVEVRRLAPGEEVAVDGPLLLALDGERKRRLVAGERVHLSVIRDGPWVVDVAAVMARVAADRAYLFTGNSPGNA